MTEDEALQIVAKMRSGYAYAMEDPVRSEIDYYKYDAGSGAFLFESFSTAAAFPIEDESYTEEDFTSLLTHHFEYKEFASEMYLPTQDKP